MATELENTITYLASDFDTIKQELIDKVRETESWVDLYEGGIGMTLLELFSYVGDMLSFYINMMANETYLDTAKLRSSVISLCKMIRYKLSLPSSASCDVKFTLSAVHTEDIIIPQFTKLSRFDDELGEPVYYLTDDILPLLTGETEGTISVTQGQRITGVSIGTSTGESNQQFALNVTDIAAGSIKLYVDGEAWEEAEFLIDYDEDDEMYRVDWEADEQLYVTFGDNRVGKIPPENSVITFDYTQTDEDYGNTGLNTITSIIDPILDDIGGDVTNLFTATNTSQATGGGATESTEHAKIYAPKISRAADRAVVIEDYEALIGNISSIAKNNCVDRKTSDGIPFRQVWLYAVPDGGGPLSSTQQQTIDELMQLKALAGTDWLIKETDFVTFNIDLTYYYSNPNYINTIEIQIRDALRDYFAINNEERVYGETIYKNTLIAMLTELSQVALVELHSPTTDTELTYSQYPILGTITLRVGGLV